MAALPPLSEPTLAYPTADERVLPGGTAHITDVGMSGPYDSVIGVKKELVMARFLNNMPARFEAASGTSGCVRWWWIVMRPRGARRIQRLTVT